jgi:hypothetical protein
MLGRAAQHVGAVGRLEQASSRIAQTKTDQE